ncbi:MAG: hypothetical protein WDA02_05885 [Saccharofermentanales bacterium]|jgi:hypothetical protein
MSVDKNNDKNVGFIGKVAKFPKNTKAKNAYNFLENIKVSKKRLWYILIEKDNNGLQVIKYNNKSGFDLGKFVNELKQYYMKDENMISHISNLVIEGEDKFSIIKNIPDVEINGQKLITILTNDLIKLLH